MLQRGTLSNQPPRAEIGIVGGFSDLGISGTADSGFRGTKTSVIGTSLHGRGAARDRDEVEAHGHAANASTAGLRSAWWHDGEIDTDVKLVEPESFSMFTLPVPSTARRRSRIGSRSSRR